MFHKHPQTESKELIDSKTIKGKEKRAHGKTISAMILGFMVAMMAAVPVFAKGSGDVWTDFGNGLLDIISGIKPFTTALAIIALVVGGLGCIIGGEASREKFKRAFPWIVGGAVIVLLAGPLAEKIIDSAGKHGSDSYSVTQSAGTGLIQLNSFLATVGLPIVNI
mgnify:CR=1 FL=1